MPRIESERIGAAFDMRGCPNRCRHCWLGSAGRRELSEADVRREVEQIRRFLDRADRPVRRLTVASWFREPDYGDDYRRLHELEAELSDGGPERYELLSVWRLARDPGYADWARSVGPDTAQISFFGMRETNDWFHRRSGAFDDALIATERLLDAGMKPRWQVFLTTRLLPDLGALLDLVEKLDLRGRVAALGGEFRILLHPPSPDHAARGIEDLRPTAEQVADLPDSIIEPTRKHFGREEIWRTEADLLAEILSPAGARTQFDDPPEVPWLFIGADRDVHSNYGTLEPWWRLGNLGSDRIDRILERLEGDEVPGLQALFQVPAAELARRYGDPDGRKVYSSPGDLLFLYRARHLERESAPPR